MSTHTDVSVAVQDTGEEIQRLKDTLLQCLRVIQAARPSHAGGSTSVQARTYDVIPPVIHALEAQAALDELRPPLRVLNGILNVNDNRVIYGLELSGKVPPGLEERTYDALNRLLHHLWPVIQRPESLWKRTGRKL